MKKKKAKPEAVLVTADDWEGLYIDGKLVEEDHRLHLRDVMSYFDVDLKLKKVDMGKLNNLPALLKDVKTQ